MLTVKILAGAPSEINQNTYPGFKNKGSVIQIPRQGYQ